MFSVFEIFVFILFRIFLDVRMCDGWRGFILLGSILLYFEFKYKIGLECI